MAGINPGNGVLNTIWTVSTLFIQIPWNIVLASCLLCGLLILVKKKTKAGFGQGRCQLTRFQFPLETHERQHGAMHLAESSLAWKSEARWGRKRVSTLLLLKWESCSRMILRIYVFNHHFTYIIDCFHLSCRTSQKRFSFWTSVRCCAKLSTFDLVHIFESVTTPSEIIPDA